MAKKRYPGGFRLTLKTARALAVREFGTAKGLEREPGMPEGYYHMMIGNLEVQIHPSRIDWAHFGQEIETLCQNLGLDYYIKDSLRAEMEKV